MGAAVDEAEEARPSSLCLAVGAGEVETVRHHLRDHDWKRGRHGARGSGG